MNIEFNAENHEYKVSNLKVPCVTEILSASGMVNLWNIPVFALEAARKLGTAVHMTCEYYDKKILKEKTLDKNIVPYLNGWKKFLKEHQAKLLSIENRLYSKKWGFAGMLDRVAIINGRLIVIDIKTTTTISPAVDIQLAGYKILYEDNYPEKINQRWAVQLLPSGDYKLHVCKNNYDDSVFLSALQLWKWRTKNKLMEQAEYEREVFGL